jgi:NitT/TauT family transport system substrate-binding protein
MPGVRFRGMAVIGAAFAVLAALRPAAALDTVTLGTDWRAEAEHGGYYQAIAAGIYRKYGIEVKLRQGGPQVNHAQLLAANRIDFGIVSNSFLTMNFAKQKIPVVAVAAFFQKDPTVLIAHQGAGDSLAALKGRPMMLSADSRVGWWLFLKGRFGYSDDQLRPYTFNVAPFLADPRAVQQGYLTSEPYLIAQAGGKPQVFLLADAGYVSYGSILETSAALIAKNPDLVQRFVKASVEGWYGYLYGDASAANALIKRDNPEETDALLSYAIASMKQHGVVDSGDATALGIGAMTDQRWRDFFDAMAGQGLYPRDMDYSSAYTLRFVDRGFGRELRH